MTSTGPVPDRKLSRAVYTRAIGAYAAVACLTVAVVGVVLQLWRADLSIPFSAGGDATFQQVLVRAIVRNGWYSPNPSLGMPDGADLGDFPMPENLPFLVIRFLSLFTHDDVVVFNLFFLLTFPLIAVSATVVCRRFGLSLLVSTLVGLLFSLLPYHFFRGQGHLILSAYFLIPPIVLVCWWLTMEDAVFFPEVAKSPTRPRWQSRRAVAAGLICLLVSATGVYYALFSALLLTVAGTWAAWARRRLYPAVAAAVLVSVLALGLLANLSPNLLHWVRHGHNAAAAVRVPYEAEIYGLKIVQMILPVQRHRLQVLTNLMNTYAKAPLNTENSGASLGIVGVVGFLALLGALFRPRGSAKSDSLPELLPRLNLALVLLGTIGGFGSLVAILVSPMIRGYNRVSVFIAFLALVRVGILLDGLRGRVSRSVDKRLAKQLAFVGLLVLVGVLGILDQTTEASIPPYARSKVQFLQDAEFVRRIEAALPSSSMVFQLPYIAFPEGANAGMSSYALLAPYLHSRSLRWSFGAMRGRATDRWQRDIALLPVGELVESVAAAGFSAIYIDRSGYPDRAAALERDFTEMLQSRPLQSPDQEVMVFPIVEWTRHYREHFTDKEWTEKREAVLHPAVVSIWPHGFSEAETWGARTWRWCSGDGVLSLVNVSDQRKTIKIDMIVSTAHPEPSRFTVQIGSEVESFEVTSKGRPFSKELTLLPGATEIHFSSDARPAVAPGDTRTLVFRIDGFGKHIR